jgi:hypothetical protein
MAALVIMCSVGVGAWQTCPNGRIWTECSKDCEKTCGKPTPECKDECSAKCECPAADPVWREDVKRCLEASMCDYKFCTHTTCTISPEELVRVTCKKMNGFGTSCIAHPKLIVGRLRTTKTKRTVRTQTVSPRDTNHPVSDAKQ